MNNRRTFLTKLATSLVVISAPSIFIPKLIEHPRWKVNECKWMTNPEWIDATYEIAFRHHSYESMVFTHIPSIQEYILRYRITL